MNEIVCYTCITNKWDKLKEPKIINKNIDYICFTDNIYLKSRVWKIFPIHDFFNKFNKIKQQRLTKILAHCLFPKYTVSVWIDGSIQLKDDLMQFINQYDLNLYSLYVRKHPVRNCIYQEIKKVNELKKENLEITEKLLKKYQFENYPKHYGLVETGILLRKHNDKKCQDFCNQWAQEIIFNSHRDQLSFNYVCWKNNFKYGILANEFDIINKNRFFELKEHGTR